MNFAFLCENVTFTFYFNQVFCGDKSLQVSPVQHSLLSRILREYAHVAVIVAPAGRTSRVVPSQSVLQTVENCGQCDFDRCS